MSHFDCYPSFYANNVSKSAQSAKMLPTDGMCRQHVGDVFTHVYPSSHAGCSTCHIGNLCLLLYPYFTQALIREQKTATRPPIFALCLNTSHQI